MKYISFEKLDEETYHDKIKSTLKTFKEVRKWNLGADKTEERRFLRTSTRKNAVFDIIIGNVTIYSNEDTLITTNLLQYLRF